MTNAAREGARTGTIYIYDRTLSKAQNDLARNEAIKTAVLASMNLLGKTSPQLRDRHDLDPERADVHERRPRRHLRRSRAGVTDTDARTGSRSRSSATYHQDLIMPIDRATSCRRTPAAGSASSAKSRWSSTDGARLAPSGARRRPATRHDAARSSSSSRCRDRRVLSSRPGSRSTSAGSTASGGSSRTRPTPARSPPPTR